MAEFHGVVLLLLYPTLDVLIKGDSIGFPEQLKSTVIPAARITLQLPVKPHFSLQTPVQQNSKESISLCWLLRARVCWKKMGGFCKIKKCLDYGDKWVYKFSLVSMCFLRVSDTSISNIKWPLIFIHHTEHWKRILVYLRNKSGYIL